MASLTVTEEAEPVPGEVPRGAPRALRRAVFPAGQGSPSGAADAMSGEVRQAFQLGWGDAQWKEGRRPFGLGCGSIWRTVRGLWGEDQLTPVSGGRSGTAHHGRVPGGTVHRNCPLGPWGLPALDCHGEK